MPHLDAAQIAARWLDAPAELEALTLDELRAAHLELLGDLRRVLGALRHALRGPVRVVFFGDARGEPDWAGRAELRAGKAPAVAARAIGIVHEHEDELDTIRGGGIEDDQALVLVKPDGGEGSLSTRMLRHVVPIRTFADRVVAARLGVYELDDVIRSAPRSWNHLGSPPKGRRFAVVVIEDRVVVLELDERAVNR